MYFFILYVETWYVFFKKEEMTMWMQFVYHANQYMCIEQIFWKSKE
jgi:hypothetical protein